jgi:hypothetical protein
VIAPWPIGRDDLLDPTINLTVNLPPWDRAALYLAVALVLVALIRMIDRRNGKP